MQNTSKTLEITSPQIKKADSIEELLCLSTMIAVKAIPANSSVTDLKYFIEYHRSDCNLCPFNTACLACAINE
jgi:hypothetical protein